MKRKFQATNPKRKLVSGRYVTRIKGFRKQIESELKFLNSQAVKHLVHEADFGACHDLCPTIENRKKKLKKLLGTKKERKR